MSIIITALKKLNHLVECMKTKFYTHIDESNVQSVIYCKLSQSYGILYFRIKFYFI